MPKPEDYTTMEPEAMQTHARELASSLLSDDTLKPWDRSAILLYAFCILANETGLPIKSALEMAHDAIPLGYLSVMVSNMADEAERREGK